MFLFVVCSLILTCTKERKHIKVVNIQNKDYVITLNDINGESFYFINDINNKNSLLDKSYYDEHPELFIVLPSPNMVKCINFDNSTLTFEVKDLSNIKNILMKKGYDIVGVTGMDNTYFEEFKLIR